MRYYSNGSPAAAGGKIPALGLALLLAIVVTPTVCYTQDAPQNTTRKAQRFSFSFEPDEAVEIHLTASQEDEEAARSMELTANEPAAEPVRANEFLTLNLFNGRTLIASTEFNLSRLRLIRITAVRTGFGNAELYINRMSAGIVPIRRSRIYLRAQALVSTTERDFQTDELILIPSDTSLKGLMTFVDRDGGRRTRTIVTSTITVPVAETE
jgi:hypothetical protein